MKIGSQNATVIGGWAVAIARAIESYGIDSQPLFKASGLNIAQALDTNARYPVTKISRLMRLAVDATADPNFGLTVARFIRPTSWHALGISIWASRSLEEGHERMIRYRRMFHAAWEVKMEETADFFVVTMAFPEAYRPLLCDEDMDAISATVVLTCRHLLDGFRPHQVHLARPTPEDTEGFHRLFRCPVIFNCDQNQILVDKKVMRAPMLTANAELAMLNDRLIQEYLNRLDRHDIINRIYLKLLESLGREIPDQRQLAEELHLSQRSLQRKLQQAGTSYQEILDHLRQEMADQYLQQSHLSINEISFRLGFSKVGSFTRAFKRWNGCSPSEYRQRQGASDHSSVGTP